MNSQLLTSFLQVNRFINPLTAEEIAAGFIERTVAKNNYLLEEGKICDTYYFLEKGFMRGFAHDTNGNDVTTAFYSAGQLVFEASSFFNRTPSKENIQALQDCSGCYITYEELNHLFHSRQEFREFGRSILVRGLSSLKTRMLSMITETAEQRYNTLLKNNPEIFQQAALKHIASYLGITDTSLSRIRKEYSKK
ncbi:MAG: Crp/Fnr family transcriptional regulator [Ferruginibacter sp.]